MSYFTVLLEKSFLLLLAVDVTYWAIANIICKRYIKLKRCLKKDFFNGREKMIKSPCMVLSENVKQSLNFELFKIMHSFLVNN